jgi:hypothetical protein
MLRRGVMLTLVVVLVSCDDAIPTAPVVPNVGGKWEGGFVITSCTPSQPECSDSCRGATGRRSTARAVLEASGVDLSGPLSLYLDDPFFVRTGSVTGQVTPAGAVSLAGAIPEIDRQTGRVSRYFDVSWNAAVTGDTMTGGFVYVTRNASGTGCTTRESATLEAFVRVP